MKRAVRCLWVAMPLAVVCHGPMALLAATMTKAEYTTTVSNTVTIGGAPDAVFDLVTSARLWPQWHPATRAVAGVVERPYQRGDLIHERARIGTTDFAVTWKVVEHARPSKVVLESQTAPARITYLFKAAGEATLFTRTLEYQTEDAAGANDLEKTMREQSEKALEQLKNLLEKILSEETKPLM